MNKYLVADREKQGTAKHLQVRHSEYSAGMTGLAPLRAQTKGQQVISNLRAYKHPLKTEASLKHPAGGLHKVCPLLRFWE